MSAGSNSFGTLFKWTTFGESHGPAMGVVIDGCPAGVEYNERLLLEKLSRRKPGGAGVTARVESDQPKVLSGIFEGKTLGSPIAVIVENQGQRSVDYESLKQNPRLGHADDLWAKKFGHSDWRGGGRASARETLNWVIAGCFAEMFLKPHCPNLTITARLVEVGGDEVQGVEDRSLIKKLEEAKTQGESFGAIVELILSNPPAALGEPVFLKAKSEMARAFMTINACCGVELGGGFDLSKQKGTEVHRAENAPAYGGLRGGITTGETLFFRLAFKPTSSILDTAKKGRHDPCVAVRALPVVEAMAWNVLADLVLMRRLNVNG